MVEGELNNLGQNYYQLKYFSGGTVWFEESLFFLIAIYIQYCTKKVIFKEHIQQLFIVLV